MAFDLQQALRTVVEREGSDLHIKVPSPPLMRVQGRLEPLENTEPLAPADTERVLREMMPDSERLNEFAREGEIDFSHTVNGLARFRVNAFRQRGEPGMVVRRIRATIASLDQIGAPEILKTLSLERRGLVLVTGATGSGKSTTLAAMIDHRNANLPGHIVTLEDPIEFVHAHKKSIVTQREIGLDTPSYATGLKNALRQAPSVMLVGEIRDGETAEAAIHFAETGHLVLATLHSTNANQTLERMVNLFPPALERNVLHQMSLNLRAVVSQRLLVRKDGKGRVPAVEVLMNTPRAADLIKAGKIEEIKEAMVVSTGEGSQTFDAHIHALYAAGLVTEDAALAAADSPNDLRLRIRLDSGGPKAGSGIRILTS
jgi:twitching motility protein PilU